MTTLLRGKTGYSVTGGRLLDPSQGIDEEGALVIENSLIKGITKSLRLMPRLLMLKANWWCLDLLIFLHTQGMLAHASGFFGPPLPQAALPAYRFA